MVRNTMLLREAWSAAWVESSTIHMGIHRRWVTVENDEEKAVLVGRTVVSVSTHSVLPPFRVWTPRLVFCLSLVAFALCFVFSCPCYLSMSTFKIIATLWTFPFDCLIYSSTHTLPVSSALVPRVGRMALRIE